MSTTRVYRHSCEKEVDIETTDEGYFPRPLRAMVYAGDGIDARARQLFFTHCPYCGKDRAGIIAEANS